jgi:DNA-binding winged helix-turn-helix (wHTH) protein
MTRRIDDILVRHRTEALSGRDGEMALLMRLLHDDRPDVMHIYGIPGIGKSSLLRGFAARIAQEAPGAIAITLDCRSIEPTERGVLQALGRATGWTMTDLASATDQIGHLAARVVLLFDEFHLLRLMDAWLCQQFIPALTENVRIACFSRKPPAPHWLTLPQWRGRFSGLRLDTLADEDAEALMREAGVSPVDMPRIKAIGRGHPLALHLAIMAALERPGLDLTEGALSSAIARLADLTLADIADLPTRRAVEAASLVRRVTIALLSALFPDSDGPALYRRLRDLPIVEQLPDGLAIHDAVRTAIAASLKAAAPDRVRQYRGTAWRHLRGQIRTAPADELWRHTADAIYLLDNPVVREAFFPGDPQTLTVAPAQPGDGDAILDLTERHDGPEGAAQIALWWSRQRRAFHVVRDHRQRIVGFYCLALAQEVDPLVSVEDPVAAAWWRHEQQNPVQRGRKVLFLRRWLSETGGEAPSPVQAACWLDIKRTYLELRPELRRVYLTLREAAPYLSVSGRLGFRVIEEAMATLDGVPYHSAMLDFGPASVDGWITGLLGMELAEEKGVLLDAGARELVLDQTRIALSAKEFSLFQYLYANPERAVPRDELLSEVWGWKFDGGSNVVDALVLVLRRKLGPHAAIVQTVRGIGYRYRDPITDFSSVPHSAGRHTE